MFLLEVTPVSPKKSLFKSPAATQFDLNLSLQETESISCNILKDKNTGYYL